MTRTYSKEPAWTWRCDHCGREDAAIARTQRGLPGFDDMRRKGWHIAKKYGDLCPPCNREEKTR